MAERSKERMGERVAVEKVELSVFAIVAVEVAAMAICGGGGEEAMRCLCRWR